MSDHVTSNKLSLAHRLLAAQRDLTHIAPDGKNAHHNYRYVKAETLIAECREVLHHHGLMLVGGDFIVEETALQQDTKTGKVCVIRCVRTAQVMCPDTAETLAIRVDWLVASEAGRPIDKACGVASTAGLGYLIRDLLQIPRVDEDQNDDAYDRRQAKVRTPEPINSAQKDEINRLCKAKGLTGVGFKKLLGTPKTFDEGEDAIAKLGAMTPVTPPGGAAVADPSRSTTSGSALVDVYQASAQGVTVASQSATDLPVSGLAEKSDGKPARTTAQASSATTTPPRPESPGSDGKQKKTTTSVLLAFKKAVDAAKTAPAVALLLASWFDELNTLPARPRLVADGYVSGHLKTLAGELRTDEEERIKMSLTELSDP